MPKGELICLKNKRIRVGCGVLGFLLRVKKQKYGIFRFIGKVLKISNLHTSDFTHKY